MVSATEYRNRKSVLRKDPVQLGEAQMHENHAAIVFDTTVGGPAVSPSGQKCPFYQTRPGSRQSGLLSL